ncbi:MAG: hypothetical protein LBS84_10185 [Clostridiales bacterium]|jgi:hypothetical protein|nr:hypothetical protein [Clostridiales bacterium]
MMYNTFRTASCAGIHAYDGDLALSKLLKGGGLSDEEMESLSLCPGERWVCFKLKKKSVKDHMPKNYMYAALNALMPNTANAILHDNAIIGVLKIMENTAVGSETISLFQSILSKMGYAAGVSDHFTDIARMADYLFQAEYASEQIADDRLVLSHFENHALGYILSRCKGNHSLEQLNPRGLSALIEYDRQRKTSYVETLDRYLANETSITRTSE